MKIPKNIEKGVTRIAAVAAVLALIVGFAVGARLYYKANSQYGLAVDDRGGLKGEWVRPVMKIMDYGGLWIMGSSL